jgi:hypothetical protein
MWGNPLFDLLGFNSLLLAVEIPQIPSPLAGEG